MDRDPPSRRAPLSLVLITRNAASQLRACIDSASDDDTVQVSASMGARVIDQPWLGFGPQKQFAVGRAKHDWVLCLDADERVTPELAASIAAALAAPSAH